MVPTRGQPVGSEWLPAHLGLGARFLAQLVIPAQRVGQHLLPPHPGRRLLAWRVVHAAVPCRQIRGRCFCRRLCCLFRLHADGCRVPIVVDDVPYLTEPFPTRRAFMPATGHAGRSSFYTRRPFLRNIHGFLV
ncbi:hypothetical protein ISF_01009 [Cordyceps fumosorosea ARSEF 2679]|uniref:Uncharacterized protein n=1 Tax=Cordyceps fumosorosea (strain ARSEF 2679) TaxID=1081104 RepID=A0A168EQT8_CORFA|nr:hypothetical protein ISF_01009 [Cordyceps fumosorosea ARSEF 2679]OAA74108.1 hypothetical protein ISF_01009 [Cordyceps fumosorosea ARSEF 2679]